MTLVPAICHNCGVLYGANVLEGAILENTLLGNNPIPCPNCGNMGYTMEGLYSSIGNTVRIIANTIKSKNALILLGQKLAELNAKGVDPSFLKNELEKNVPELKNISDALPKTRSELYAFIAILLSALTILISTITNVSTPSHSVTEKQVEKIVMEAIEQTITKKMNTNK